MKPYMSDLCFNAFKRVNISSSSKCSDLDSFRFAVGMFRGWGGRKVIIVFAGRGGGVRGWNKFKFIHRQRKQLNSKRLLNVGWDVISSFLKIINK